MRSRWLVALPLMLVAVTAWAESNGPIPEFRPVMGAYVPTGDLRDVLKDGMLLGVQGGVEVADRLHVIGTFAWSPTEDARLLMSDGVSLYQYDAGLELFQVTSLTSAWSLRPFLGAGVGGRTFDYSDRAGSPETYLTGYGALGTEFQTGRFALRLEARDYVYRFKGLRGEQDTATRNDLTLMAGASLHLW